MSNNLTGDKDTREPETRTNRNLWLIGVGVVALVVVIAMIVLYGGGGSGGGGGGGGGGY
jgi:uncharacterized membrane protein